MSRVIDAKVFIAADEMDTSSADDHVIVIDGDTLRIVISKTPASSTASGYTGEFVWDSNYLYVCVATDTWKRIGLSSWS